MASSYPLLQKQEKDPALFLQPWLHPPLPDVHSFTSTSEGVRLIYKTVQLSATMTVDYGALLSVLTISLKQCVGMNLCVCVNVVLMYVSNCTGP